jgi:hypothetical protein
MKDCKEESGRQVFEMPGHVTEARGLAFLNFANVVNPGQAGGS